MGNLFITFIIIYGIYYYFKGFIMNIFFNGIVISSFGFNKANLVELNIYVHRYAS